MGAFLPTFELEHKTQVRVSHCIGIPILSISSRMDIWLQRYWDKELCKNYRQLFWELFRFIPETQKLINAKSILRFNVLCEQLGTDTVITNAPNISFCYLPGTIGRVLYYLVDLQNYCLIEVLLEFPFYRQGDEA